MTTRICAIIAAKNEYHYLKTLLPILSAQGIDVAILDHGSSDDSNSLYERYRGQPIVALEPLPDDGVFRLSAQMQAKQELASRLQHEWFVHHDADELMHHRDGISGLRTCIEQAASQGANGVNFEEFVFLPNPDSQSHPEGDHTQKILQYYYLKNSNTLHRAFHRSLIGQNIHSGGHALTGENVILASVDHVLRHYIGLSQAHIRLKYENRVFCPQELTRGWHRKRRSIKPERLVIPKSSPYLFHLAKPWPGAFNRSRSTSKHYWLWSEDERH